MRVLSRSQKDNLKQAEAAEEMRLVRSQREYLELELRRFRRRRMLALHHKEQELLREVLCLPYSALQLY